MMTNPIKSFRRVMVYSALSLFAVSMVALGQDGIDSLIRPRNQRPRKGPRRKLIPRPLLCQSRSRFLRARS